MCTLSQPGARAVELHCFLNLIELAHCIKRRTCKSNWEKLIVQIFEVVVNIPLVQIRSHRTWKEYHRVITLLPVPRNALENSNYPNIPYVMNGVRENTQVCDWNSQEDDLTRLVKSGQYIPDKMSSQHPTTKGQHHHKFETMLFLPARSTRPRYLPLYFTR